MQPSSIQLVRIEVEYQILDESGAVSGVRKVFILFPYTSAYTQYRLLFLHAMRYSQTLIIAYSVLSSHCLCCTEIFWVFPVWFYVFCFLLLFYLNTFLFVPLCSPQNLSQKMDVFYLTPESFSSGSSLWFTSTSLDRNTLENMLIRVLLVKDIYDKNSYELDEDTD